MRSAAFSLTDHTYHPGMAPWQALKDSMVYPNEGEHWGHFAEGSLSKVLTMRETPWYQRDRARRISLFWGSFIA